MKFFTMRPTGLAVRTAMLLLCVLAANTAMAQDKQVTLSARTISLGEAFDQIEAQTGYNVAYSATKLDESRTVRLSSASGTLAQILTQLLAGTRQTFEVRGEYIILRVIPRPDPVVSKPEPEAEIPQPEQVKGVSIPAISHRVTLTPESEPVPTPRGGYASAWRLTETPRFALKTNLLYDLATTISLAAELRTGHKWTVDLSMNLNPWTYNKEENTKFKFFLFQPEVRRWTCEAFNGSFFGLHAHYAYYNVGHLPNPPFSQTMNEYRFEGQLAGAGLSYGYHWILGPRLGLEGEIGVGYARLWYKKYPCQSCGKQLAEETKNYWGPTRAALSLIYTF